VRGKYDFRAKAKKRDSRMQNEGEGERRTNDKMKGREREEFLRDRQEKRQGRRTDDG